MTDIPDIKVTPMPSVGSVRITSEAMRYEAHVHPEQVLVAINELIEEYSELVKAQRDGESEPQHPQVFSLPIHTRQLTHALDLLVDRAIWFQVTPLPHELWLVSVKFTHREQLIAVGAEVHKWIKG